MTNSVWQATIQNAAGDIVPGAEITVIDEGTGLNAVIYSSKAGAALTNPFNADAGGFAQFYSGPGEYRISAHDLGTGLTQTFDNWRLGDAGARDIGTATGQVLLSESAGLDNGETNWTSGNVNEFGKSAGAVGSGTASSTSVARIEIPILSNIAPVSITIAGVFNLLDASHGLVKAGATIALSSSSTTRLLILDATGTTLVDGAVYVLYAASAGSKITVNY